MDIEFILFSSWRSRYADLQKRTTEKRWHVSNVNACLGWHVDILIYKTSNRSRYHMHATRAFIGRMRESTEWQQKQQRQQQQQQFSLAYLSNVNRNEKNLRTAYEERFVRERTEKWDNDPKKEMQMQSKTANLAYKTYTYTHMIQVTITATTKIQLSRHLSLLRFMLVI